MGKKNTGGDWELSGTPVSFVPASSAGPSPSSEVPSAAMLQTPNQEGPNSKTEHRLNVKIPSCLDKMGSLEQTLLFLSRPRLELLLACHLQRTLKVIRFIQ